MDFAKKVAVPAVANLRELGTVLQESRVFDSGDVNQALNLVQQGIGSDAIGVGIKTVLDCIIEARQGRPDVETFAELMIEKVQELRG